jgi:hypothetical protein
MLKGVGIEAFWKPMGSLLIFAAFFLGIASLRIKKAKT